MSVALHPQTQSSPRAVRRPVRLLTRAAAAPVRIRDSRGIFELTKALKSADKALVVWTLRGWVAHNQAKKKAYRDGHHWTFSPLEKWQAKYFQWLSVKQLGTLMTQLVRQGIVIRTRRSVHCCYWYRVDETALAALCESSLFLTSQTAGLSDKTAERTDKSAELSDKTAPQFAQTAEHKTVVSKQENIKEQKSNQQKPKQLPPTTPRAGTHARTHESTAVKAVVVVETEPRRDPEPESGEYSLDGEESQPLAEHDSVLVEAGHSPTPNTGTISKVPLKVLTAETETARDLVAAMMVPYARLGLTEDYAARLISTYGEDAVRACHQFVQANWKQFPAGHKSRIFNAPGWMTNELATKRVNPLSVPVETDLPDNPVLTPGEADALLCELSEADPDLPTAAPVPAPQTPGIDAAALARWATAVALMRPGMNERGPAVWDNTVGKARLVDYTASTQTYTLTGMMSWLYGKYRDQIQPILEQVHGGPCAVDFEVYA